MKRFTTLAIFIALVTITFAQTHMYVWKNGAKTNYVISEVDSITFGDEKGIGVFSVGENKKVAFSTGNLQHNPKRNEWRFAESQLDYIGDANSNISHNYDGWIDLFGWSTDGNPETQFGVSTSINDRDYAGTFVDWGTNKISGDKPNTWRTLHSTEWEYLWRYRPNANNLIGIAQVNGVNGLVILPDNWITPNDIIFTPGIHSEWGLDFSIYQSFTIIQWQEMESIGAVFLPAAGDRNGDYIQSVQSWGLYYTATGNGNNGEWAFWFYFNVANWGIGTDGSDDGLSVRLVKDVVTE